MTQDDATAGRVARVIVQRLESIQRAGVTHLGKVPRGEVSAAAVADVPRETPKADDRAAALAEVAREVAACTRCTELARTRTQTVFGVGNPHARLVFCGEAPGYDEDRQGEPFVGRAGQLLNKIIAACTLRREEVYILNILRCRPPDNRNPLPPEAANCREYLDRQLAIIQPEFICCLGAVAAQNLLQTTASIGRLRGSFHDYNGIKVLCTYHPAYLLRNPAAKRPTWEDMQLLMAEMGIKLPQQ
jgi:uracil-DNA glycosylase family 4